MKRETSPGKRKEKQVAGTSRKMLANLRNALTAGDLRRFETERVLRVIDLKRRT